MIYSKNLAVIYVERGIDILSGTNKATSICIKTASYYYFLLHQLLTTSSTAPPTAVWPGYEYQYGKQDNERSKYERDGNWGICGGQLTMRSLHSKVTEQSKCVLVI